ncbi:MAG: hypothetical protein U1E06_00445 [Tabrizicola sp.]|nr:hypothetical protein [Tabrizicola sp.]MDZ4065318.1 hypothetical protein [Tabrizicola sp.]
MLTLTESLPTGALIGGERHALAAAVAQSDGRWFAATPDAVVREADAITGWRAMTGDVTAKAAAPNSGNSRLEKGPPHALACEAGLHCGFELGDFAPKVDRFTAAVVYTSPRNEAKTLLAVRTGASRNVIYLTEADGVLQATDRDGSFSVTLPLSALGGPTRLAILCYTGRGIVLRAGGLTVAEDGRASDMNHPGTFLIGCRSSRSGLAKTLGASLLHDVLFWPDRALLASDLADDHAALAALARHYRWAY